jgi:hypothetical protein
MKYFVLIMALLAAFFVFLSCEKDNAPIGGNMSQSGTLTLYLTDAPAVAFDSVNIIFSQVSAHLDSTWITVQDSQQTVNLLDLNNGNTIIFGSNEVPAGKYTQIRIIIDDAYVVIDGQKHQMTVPSGAKTGLKLGPQFTITEGSTYKLVVDFDACRSVVTTGPPHNPSGYKLKPHLRVMPMAVSGSISGTVTNPEHLSVAYAIQNPDTITTSAPDTTTGFFRLAFLPSGSYSVFVKDTLGQAFNQDSVFVNVGEETNIGNITLQ